MATQRVVLTYEDYAATPSDGQRYQILEGEVFVTAAPVPLHQRVVGRLHELLAPHVREHRIGEMFLSPIAVILAQTTIVEPDLVYLDAARASLVSDRGIEGAPTVLVEVLSPSTTKIDRGTKRQLYARYGVPFYWIVDPRVRSIEVHELTDADYRLVTSASGPSPVALPPFPDLAFAPESLWS